MQVAVVVLAVHPRVLAQVLGALVVAEQAQLNLLTQLLVAQTWVAVVAVGALALI
jgi:hypothetical protein